MDAYSTELNNLRKIVSKLYLEMDEAIGIKQLLDCGNADDAITTFNEAPEARILLLVRNALMQRLIMSLMRMHDRAGTERASLPQVFALLEKIRSLPLNVDGKEWLQVAREKWDIFQSAEGVNRHRTVRNLRNNYLAHNITGKDEVERPNYNDVFSLLEDSSHILECLAAGLKVCFVRFDSARDVWRNKGTAYWQTLIRGEARRCSFSTVGRDERSEQRIRA